MPRRSLVRFLSSVRNQSWGCHGFVLAPLYRIGASSSVGAMLALQKSVSTNHREGPWFESPEAHIGCYSMRAFTPFVVVVGSKHFFAGTVISRYGQVEPENTVGLKTRRRYTSLI